MRAALLVERPEFHGGSLQPPFDIRKLRAEVDRHVGARGRPMVGVLAEVYLRPIVGLEPLGSKGAQLVVDLKGAIAQNLDEEAGLGAELAGRHRQVDMMESGHDAIVTWRGYHESGPTRQRRPS